MIDESTKALEAAVREAYVEEASELLRRLDVAENALLTAQGPARTELVRAIARSLHTLKGASAASGHHALKNECHRIEELLSGFDVAAASASDPGLLAAREGIAGLRALFSQSPYGAPSPPPHAPLPELGAVEPEVATHQPSGTAVFGAETLRVRPERVDSLHALASELVVLRLQADAHLRRLAEVRESFSDLATTVDRLLIVERRERGRTKEGGNRVLRGLEEIADAIASRLANLVEVSSVLASAESEVASVSDSILAGVSELRMMPLAPFFETFVSVARDAAHEMGSEARVSIRTQGTELDRSVLMRLREPMLHLVRNAVAHGIERTEERLRTGKAPIGHILLEGRSEGSKAYLRVVDDGAGIDVAKVRARAVALGILEANAADTLDGEALFEVLSRPGFSTRTEVDRLSGRGVGLDVVADVVRSLGGHVAIETVRGAGTAVAVEVPVTASTSAGLLVRSGAHRFAILLSHVERVVRVRRSQLTVSAAVTTLRIDNDAIAVVPLVRVLDLEADDGDGDSALSGVVVVHGRQRIVFLVDELLGEQALIVRPMPDAFARARQFVGAAVQEDGSVLPVLDVARLFELAVGGTTNARATPTLRAVEEDNSEISVLVVDDSVTMRTLLRNILRSAGYDVSVAHDGNAALATLAKMGRVDLVVTDLEMPEMSGEELCRSLRSSAHAHVPIVVVTSVSNEDQRNRALLAGADAYIVKSGFVQGEFLDIARRLVRRARAAA